MYSQHRYFMGFALKVMATCLLLLGLSGCGNKGDLYRVKDTQNTDQSAIHQHHMPESNEQQP